VKTKVMMTELNGCVAQSHIAHEITLLRGMGSPRSAGSIVTSRIEGRSMLSAPLLMGTVCTVWVNERLRRALTLGEGG